MATSKILFKYLSMNIGIIGAGEIGGTLIRQYTKAGHNVKMTNASGQEKLKKLASETGALPVTLSEVVMKVDVIVISIPLIGILELPQMFLENTPSNVAIIDTTNYYPIRDGKIEAIEKGMPESVWVSNQIQRTVIKAYNSIFYGSLANSGVSKGATSRVALPISGDDKRAKELVSDLINDNGFDVLDYGYLQESWKQQPGSPVYCTDLTLLQLSNSIETARKELLPERREIGLQLILKHGPEQWKDNVKRNRIIYETVLD